MTKNVLLGLLTVAAFSAAGVFAYRHFTTGADNSPTGYESAGICLACRQEVTVSHKADEIEPFACSACGQKAVYKWLYCNECHRRFIPDLRFSDVDQQWHFPQIPACRACKCTDVTGFVGDILGQLPIGDAELPKWPPTGNGK
jgi:DNA-directed RNA polymerase subunit RPC12/RpoP